MIIFCVNRNSTVFKKVIYCDPDRKNYLTLFLPSHTSYIVKIILLILYYQSSQKPFWMEFICQICLLVISLQLQIKQIPSKMVLNQYPGCYVKRGKKKVKSSILLKVLGRPENISLQYNCSLNLIPGVFAELFLLVRLGCKIRF